MLPATYTDPFADQKFNCVQTANGDLILDSGQRIKLKNGFYLVPEWLVKRELPYTLTEAAKKLGMTRQGVYKQYAQGAIIGEKGNDGIIHLSRESVDNYRSDASGSGDIMA